MSFEITSPPAPIAMGGDRRAVATFAIRNRSRVPIAASLFVIADTDADAALFSIDGSADRVLPPDTPETVRVQIAAPKAAEPGAHGFTLKVFDPERSDTVWAKSQRVDVIIPLPTAAWRRYWWRGAAAAAALVVASTVWFLARDSTSMSFDSGYVLEQFVTDTERKTAVLEHARVLVFDGELPTLEPLVPLLDQNFAGDKTPMLVVADLGEKAVWLMDITTRKGRFGADPDSFQWAAVSRPSGFRRTATLRRIATLTGTRVVTQPADLTMMKWADLGRARRIEVGAGETIIRTAVP